MSSATYQVALKTMEECFPRTVSWTLPSGGYTIWVKTPKKLTEIELHKFMSEYSVIVSPGGYYFPRKKPSGYFRISIAKSNEEEIEKGIARLGRALYSLFCP